MRRLLAAPRAASGKKRKEGENVPAGAEEEEDASESEEDESESEGGLGEKGEDNFSDVFGPSRTSAIPAMLSRLPTVKVTGKDKATVTNGKVVSEVSTACSSRRRNASSATRRP